MLVDTHVHLQEPAYADELDEVLARAAAAGVKAAIVPGTTLEDSRTAVEMAHTYQNAPCALYAAVGIHPTNAHQLTSEARAALRDLAQAPRVVAIGEIGLDYYWPRIADRGWPCAEPEVQREALEWQLTLASELGLPVVVHDRDAHADTLAMLTTWKAGDPEARGTLHAYAAGPDRLAQVSDLGFYIGMDGPVTYKKASGLRAVAVQVALDRLLLETDGPYLTPVPHRGRRNEPAYLIHVAERIAELRSISVATIEAATTENVRRLFALPA